MPAAGMGDLIMAAPVIRAVRNKFPDSYIAVLAHHVRGAKEIGDCMPYLDEVIDFPLKKYSWPSVIKFFLSSYWPMFWSLRKQKFDTVVILASNPIRTILVKMLNPPTALESKEKGHPTRKGFELVSKLGCSAEPLDFGFEVPDVDLEKIFPSSLPRPWIGIHPFSAMKWRSWKNYLDFVKILPENATIVVLGKETEHETINTDNVIDLVNILNIKELVNIINNLDLLISVDSGPMHIGFAVSTPTLGIFRLIDPEFRIPLFPMSKVDTICCDLNDSLLILKERKNNNMPYTYLNNSTVYEKIIQLCRAANMKIWKDKIYDN